MQTAVSREEKAVLPRLDGHAFATVATRLVDHVELRDMIPQACVGIDQSWRLTGVVRWTVYIQTGKSLEEQLISFVHEIVRIFHFLEGFNTGRRPSDDWAEGDARRFYDEHKELVARIFSYIKKYSP